MSPSPGLNLVTGETSSSSSSQQTITPPSKRKRSRNGCTTCKLRKKKCDEEWAETTNSCKRCTLSGFDCDGESISQPVPKKRRPFVSSQIRSTAGSGSSGNETSGRPQEVSTAQATISTLDDEVETNSGENRDPVPVNDMADFSWQDTLFGHNSPQNNGMREGISTPVLQAFVDTLTNGFPALPNTSHNNFSRHPDPSNMANLIPSASSRNEMQADQYFLPLPFHLPSVGEKDVPNDGQTFTEGMKNPNTQIMHPRSARFDIYNLIAESWFSSMPPMTREIISARMCNVTAAHKLTRAARNAVTSAYCAILKRNRSSTPRHHGSRVSSDRGAGWLRWQAEEDPARTSIGYVLRMDDPASRLHEQVERHLNGRNQETEYKLEATLNVVGWEQKASEFFQSALSSLESETATLETKLWAIMDLQLYQLARHGAAAVYPILTLGEVIINRELGAKPYLDVSDLSGSEAFVLHMFAYADVSRTICKRNRQTVFDFGPIPADGFHSARPNVSGEVCDGYLGLPSGLLACLGATANLAAKMHTELPATVDGEAVAIEGAIRRWRAHESRMDLEGTRRLSRVAVQEIWRMTAIIHLYQVVHKHEPLSPTLRTALSEIMALARGLAPHTGFLACPWFLAGTVAVSDTDRDVCRQGLLDCGPEKVWEDDLVVLERVWREMDRTGRAEDWRDLIDREGLMVAFF